MTIHDRNAGRVKPTGALMQLSKGKGKQRTTGRNQERAGRLPMRVIAFTGGKGGVGKTTIAANLGLSLSRMGKEVLILDADLGMANLDIVFGVAPRYNLSHVITGEKTLSEAVTEGPGNVRILPGSSGTEELTLLDNEQYADLLAAAALLEPAIDFLFIDTATGIAPHVRYFSSAAQDIIIVVSPDCSSVVDAYAFMKVLSLRHGRENFKVVVNMSDDNDEAHTVFRQLRRVAEKLLGASVEYLGSVPFDRAVLQCGKDQKLVSEHFPDTRAGKAFTCLADRVLHSQRAYHTREGVDSIGVALHQDLRDQA